MKNSSKINPLIGKLYRYLMAMAFIFYYNPNLAQSSSTGLGNFPALTTDFLGWDATVTEPIMLRHFHPNQHIEFHTNGQERMRVNASGNVCIGTTIENAA